MPGALFRLPALQPWPLLWARQFLFPAAHTGNVAFYLSSHRGAERCAMGGEGTMAMVQGHGDTVTGPGPAGHSHGDVAVRATWQ